MSDLPAKHYLWIYQRRVSMAEEGVTNPTQAVVQSPKELVSNLSILPPDEKIRLETQNGEALFTIAGTGVLVGRISFADTEL